MVLLDIHLYPGRYVFSRKSIINGVVVFLLMILFATPALSAMTDYPQVRLRSLDKMTARTMTFDAKVGTTVKFGSLYIKVLACQKPDVQERPDSAAFLQIWETTLEGTSRWIFSGWMFGASPALSAMDHPIYDVWVMDCMDDGTMKKEGPSLDDVIQNATGDATPTSLLLNPSSIPAAPAGETDDGSAPIPPPLFTDAVQVPSAPPDLEWYEPVQPSKAW